MYDFDVVFIGSGHSCWHGALTSNLLNLLKDLNAIMDFASKKILKLTGKI